MGSPIFRWFIEQTPLHLHGFAFGQTKCFSSFGLKNEDAQDEYQIDALQLAEKWLLRAPQMKIDDVGDKVNRY